MVSGKVAEVREVQPEKVFSSTTDIFEGMTIDERAVQLRKADLPIDATDSGISNRSRLEQFPSAWSPMRVTVSGRVRS